MTKNPIKIKPSIKFQFVLGIGYYIDVYDSKRNHGFDGKLYNIILPFICIYWGHLLRVEDDATRS